MSVLSENFGKMAKRGLVVLLATTAFAGCATTGYNQNAYSGGGYNNYTPQQRQQQTYQAPAARNYAAPSYSGASKESLAECNPANIFKKVSLKQGGVAFGKDGCVYSMIDGQPLPLRNYNLQSEAGANAFNYEIMNPSAAFKAMDSRSAAQMDRQASQDAQRYQRMQEQAQRQAEQRARQEEQRAYQRQRQCANSAAMAAGQLLRGMNNPAYMLRSGVNCLY